MLRGLLENEGIPSVLQALGVNGPQLGFGVLATSPQRVLVRADRAEEARTLLAQAPLAGEGDAWSASAVDGEPEGVRGRPPRGYGLAGAYLRIYLWSFGVIAVAFAIFLLLRAS